MPNLEFSVPYNNDHATLNALFKIKYLGGNRIREVYLNGPQDFAGSGRITDRLKEEEFINLLHDIHREELRANLVMNATCEGSTWYSPEVVKAKLDFITRMHQEHGLEAITVANPIYIKAIRQHLPDLEICASVLGDIDCVQRALVFAGAGANIITPDTSINRNLSLLKQINQVTGCELKLMVNEGCLYKCPFRKFHFNYMSHKSIELGPVEGDVFFANCSQVSLNDPSQILKSGWIRPEDLSKYHDITTFFKIVGRARRQTFVLRATQAYMQQAWNGDLLDIVSSSLNSLGIEFGASLNNRKLDQYEFFDKVTSCNYDCSHCHFCEELAQKLVRFQVLTRGKLEDLGLGHVADEMEKAGGLPL